LLAIPARLEHATYGLGNLRSSTDVPRAGRANFSPSITERLFQQSVRFGRCTRDLDRRVRSAVRAQHSQFAAGQGGEFGQLHCKLATQCRSNPVSSPGLPKTGIFQISAGDYRRFRSHSGLFRSRETASRFAKARHWLAYLSLLRETSPVVELPGWGGRIRTSIWRIRNRMLCLSERSRRTAFRCAR
jgi:hypothetical protein